jgi:hypothetical protein
MKLVDQDTSENGDIAMKRITAMLVITLASFVASGSALAQDPGVQANVPFDFTVGNKLLPPGTYTIVPADYGVILIQSLDKRHSVFTATRPDAHASDYDSKLIFTKYGDQYFLSEVLCPAASVNVALPMSKQEARVRVQEAMVPSSTQVLVAMK